MGIDRRIVSSEKIEALVDDPLKALKVKTWPASTADLDTLEATLTNLEKALQSINTDYLKVQARDASDNLMPSMDAVTRPGFQKVTDGTAVLEVVTGGTADVGNKYGIMAMARRGGTGKSRPLPVALYSDDGPSKGEYVVPTTPMTREQEEGTRTHTNDACFVVSYGVSGISAKTAYVLIDLSNATNYPHTEVGEIHVDWVSFCLLGDVSAEGKVMVGFITEVDATDGTFYAIACVPADTSQHVIAAHKNFNPSAAICKTANILAGGGAKYADDITFQTDVSLDGTYTSVAPAVGDLILLLDVNKGTFQAVAVEVGYHTI